MTDLNQQNSPSSSSSSPSSCSPPEERHQRSSCSSSNDEAVKGLSDHQKKSLTTPCHSLLLTSSSTSSLCSSSKHDDVQHSRRNSSYLSSESLNIAHEVELLLGDICDRVVASSDRLRSGYERLAKCRGHQSDGMGGHLRMIRGVLERRLGLRGLSDCDGTRSYHEDMIESKKRKDEKKRRDSDEDSLSVMLDDVLQYFDFLNAEGDESVDSLSASSPCEEFEAANGLSCNEDALRSRDDLVIKSRDEELSEDVVNTDKNRYDLNRLMDLHLNRLWIIEDVRF